MISRINFVGKVFHDIYYDSGLARWVIAVNLIIRIKRISDFWNTSTFCTPQLKGAMSAGEHVRWGYANYFQLLLSTIV